MNFNYQKELVQIWEKGVKLFKQGNTSPETFPITDELPFLQSIGLNKMDIFDYVEDWICEGTPDLATFLLIHDARRDFLSKIKIQFTQRLNSIQKPSQGKMKK